MYVLGSSLFGIYFFACETEMVSFSGACSSHFGSPMWQDSPISKVYDLLRFKPRNLFQLRNGWILGYSDVDHICIGGNGVKFGSLSFEGAQWICKVVGGNVWKTSTCFKSDGTGEHLVSLQVQKVRESNVPCNGGQGHRWGDLIELG